MQGISKQVARFNSKKVADYSSIELVSWYMILTTWKVRVSDAKVRESVVKALNKATAELKCRDDISVDIA